MDRDKERLISQLRTHANTCKRLAFNLGMRTYMGPEENNVMDQIEEKLRECIEELEQLAEDIDQEPGVEEL